MVFAIKHSKKSSTTVTLVSTLFLPQILATFLEWGSATKENSGHIFFFGRFCAETIRKTQKRKNHHSLGFYSFWNLREKYSNTLSK